MSVLNKRWKKQLGGSGYGYGSNPNQEGSSGYYYGANPNQEGGMARTRLMARGEHPSSLDVMPPTPASSSDAESIVDIEPTSIRPLRGLWNPPAFKHLGRIWETPSAGLIRTKVKDFTKRATRAEIEGGKPKVDRNTPLDEFLKLNEISKDFKGKKGHRWHMHMSGFHMHGKYAGFPRKGDKAALNRMGNILALRMFKTNGPWSKKLRNGTLNLEEEWDLLTRRDLRRHLQEPPPMGGKRKISIPQRRRKKVPKSAAMVLSEEDESSEDEASLGV